jgi:hypothetical protein
MNNAKLRIISDLGLSPISESDKVINERVLFNGLKTGVLRDVTESIHILQWLKEPELIFCSSRDDVWLSIFWERELVHLLVFKLSFLKR